MTKLVSELNCEGVARHRARHDPASICCWVLTLLVDNTKNILASVAIVYSSPEGVKSVFFRIQPRKGKIGIFLNPEQAQQCSSGPSVVPVAGIVPVSLAGTVCHFLTSTY